MGTVIIPEAGSTPVDDAARTVLVIDDDPAIRNLLRIMLEVEGHSVLDAENGSLGLAVASTHQPDVVVLDYMMPDRDGESVGMSLRRLAPDSTVIAFSACLVSKPYWADRFVAKSDIEDLLELV
jgi:CheY-like chemotaxis protein